MRHSQSSICSMVVHAVIEALKRSIGLIPHVVNESQHFLLVNLRKRCSLLFCWSLSWSWFRFCRCRLRWLLRRINKHNTTICIRLLRLRFRHRCGVYRMKPQTLAKFFIGWALYGSIRFQSIVKLQAVLIALLTRSKHLTAEILTALADCTIFLQCII